MSAWGRAEGGHVNNTARWNWLNTSRTGYGGVSAGISGVPHIKAYPNFDEGIQATADTIKWGYPSILAGLRAGDVSFGNAGVRSDLNKWVTGSRSTTMSKYVRGIASMTGNVPAATQQQLRAAGTTGGPAPSTIELPSAPQVKTVTRSRISQQALISSLLKAATTGNYTGALLTLAAYNSPIKEQVLVPGKPIPGAKLKPVGGLQPITQPPKLGRLTGDVLGTVTMAANADRPGMRTHQQILDFAKHVAAVYGKPLTIGTGTRHSQFVASPDHPQSAH